MLRGGIIHCGWFFFIGRGINDHECPPLPAVGAGVHENAGISYAGQAKKIEDINRFQGINAFALGTVGNEKIIRGGFVSE